MSVLRVIIILGNIEQDTLDTSTYFLDENASVYSFAGVTFLFIVLFFFMALKLGRKRSCALSKKCSSCAISSLVCGFALLGEAVIYLVSLLSDGSEPKWLGIAVLVFSVGSVIYFFYSGFHSQSRGNENLLAFAALMPILLSVFRLLSDFVRQSAIPLASSNAYHILSIIALMLFFLCEGKTLSGSGGAFTTSFFGYCAIFLLLVYALPNLFLHSYWLYAFDYLAAFSVVDVCFAVYVGARLHSLEISLPGNEIAAPGEREAKQ